MVKMLIYLSLGAKRLHAVVARVAGDNSVRAVDGKEFPHAELGVTHAIRAKLVEELPSGGISSYC